MARRTRASVRVSWTSAEIRRLKRTFRNTGTAAVAKALGRSTASVQQKAYKLGLRKTKSYLKSIGRA